MIPVARIADMLLDPGESYEFNGRRYSYPDIRLVYWAGGNPFHHHQDLNRLQRAWQKPETVIVHESWWTPTARHADIVLPATTTLERNDVGGSSRDPFVLAMHRAIDPIGEARNDFDIFRALARRLGYETAFTEDRDEMGWCQWVYDQVRASATRQGRRPARLPAVLGRGLRRAAAARARLRAVRRFPPRSRAPSAQDAVRTDRDRLRRRRRLRLRRLPAASGLAAAGGMARQRAARERWPIHLVTHQPASRLHSQMDPGPVSRGQKVDGREPIRINPPDAARRGIRDGDIVRVFNARGACLAGAVVDAGVMPGVVVMATGAWFDPARRGGSSPSGTAIPTCSRSTSARRRSRKGRARSPRWSRSSAGTRRRRPVRAFTPPQLAAAG